MTRRTLKSLHIRNFAVIDRLDIEFPEGLSVFTGETGAGKSILIEAFGFLLGQRGSTDWIRAGEDKLEVWGEFLGSEPFGMRRELDAKGRSKAFLDGKPAAAAKLASLGDALVDFHGQHEHQTLLKPAIQMELLDAFGLLQEWREPVAEAYAAWRDLGRRLESLQMSEVERLQRIDLFRFQTSEIAEVNPLPGEEEELTGRLPRLQNAEKLLTLLAEAYNELYEKDGSAEGSLRNAEEALESMASHDPSLAELAGGVARAREIAEETASALARYRESVEVSPEELDELIGRQDRIARLKRKYGGSIDEVLAYRDRIQAELDALENHAEKMEETEAELRNAEKTLRSRCDELHAARMKTAKRLSLKTAAELKDLGMDAAKVSVSVEMEEGVYSPAGSDRVEILIAPNPGEPLKPLRSIASGGELSRVMLALKTVLAAQDKVGLLVFDEVDAGVGGVVGRSVGVKLSEIASKRQVLCVTHLPQVACAGESHFHVSKKVTGGRTFTKVEALSGKARLETVARMLGGRQVTSASLRHAKELIRRP